jgi:hypothetical protein
MATMYRVTMLHTVVMALDNQTTVVLPGSVIDVPNAMTLSGIHWSPVAETPTNNFNYPSSVRNVRKK